MTPIANNVASAASLSYIASAADAQSLTEFTQFSLTDKIRTSLKDRLLDAAIFSNKIESVTDLGLRLGRYTSGPYSEITTNKIKAANAIGSTALEELFLSDGPKLGANFTEAQTLKKDLDEYGISINAPQSYPVMLEVRDKDGNLNSTSFMRLSKDSRQILEEFNQVNSAYQDSKAFEYKFSSFTIRYTSFDKYSNLLPAQSDVNNTLSNLSSQLNVIKEAFAKALADTAVAADRLQVLVDRTKESLKDQGVRINSMDAQRQEQLNATLKLLRTLRLELDSKRTQLEERFSDAANNENSFNPASGIRSIQSNASTGVAGSQNIDRLPFSDEDGANAISSSDKLAKSGKAT
jgi:hypothetical protein